jgi:hypothetical protein
MASAGAGAAAGAAAAAAAQRQMQQEEEEMTKYSPEDLDDWEFKIVRSATSAFRNPEHLRRLIAEEAQSGWIMVEKFDDARVRFKRRRGNYPIQSASGIDPYRTTYGMGQAGFALVIVVGMLIIFLAIMLFVS